MSSLILIPFFVYVSVGIIAYFFADKLIFQPQPIVYRDNDSFLKLVTPNGEKIAAKFFKNPSAEFTILFSHGNAEEIVGFVYAELYGTRMINNVRQSKFANYSGRGTLRAWLRVVIRHAVVDAHRVAPDEVSLEEWTEAGGETPDHWFESGWTDSFVHSHRLTGRDRLWKPELLTPGGKASVNHFHNRSLCLSNNERS